MAPGAHDVFISYSTSDRATAEVACKVLEASGLRCWMAPRDIAPGAIYGEALIDAIGGSQVVVLLLSPSSNVSGQVLREVERAVSRGIPVVPVRLEEGEPSRSMEVFISAAHWLDAFPPPLDGHLAALADAVAGAVHERFALAGAAAYSGPEQPANAGARRVANIPPPSPFFTGRDGVLEALATELHDSGRVVLTGLPGVGKTRVAVEYGHRHMTDYRAVMWITGETREGLLADMATLAELLQLPRSQDNDHGTVAAAVREWLETNDRWLLIVDNADDFSLVREFFPSTAGGHVVITTRSVSSGGLGRRLRVEKLVTEDAVRMIALRASLENVTHEREATEALAEALDGLPLALNQAAAFIEQVQVSPTEYLELYKAEGPMAVLPAPDGGDESVGATFGLAFGRLEDTSPAAAELLRICAFVAPDSIPEDIILKGVDHVGGALGKAAQTRLGLARVVGDSCRFSLLDRDSSNRTLTI